MLWDDKGKHMLGHLHRLYLGQLDLDPSPPPMNLTSFQVRCSSGLLPARITLACLEKLRNRNKKGTSRESPSGSMQAVWQATLV